MREIEQVEEESNHYVDKQYRLPLYGETSSPYQSQLSLYRNRFHRRHGNIVRLRDLLSRKGCENQFNDAFSILSQHLSGLSVTEKCR